MNLKQFRIILNNINSYQSFIKLFLEQKAVYKRVLTSNLKLKTKYIEQDLRVA